ncbi:AI-2E family transporter [Clostridium sp. SYSU_GA19001]|uniref:AI-2E family transporter n=1 Tax=Clostridium caldaquaticum TaxID=2940653 RepID=UPI00207726B5|nr:AI-2E family transporter [Clostridium caldaquaticum]MCM8710226.1 AI-2E family transporter [Clostridium caldaquaticum]
MLFICKKLIYIFVVINLILISLILLGKINCIQRLTVAAIKTFLIPLFISVLFFYLIRPLNNIFIKKGIKRGKASLLTLVICMFVLGGITAYFSRYAYGQFRQLVQQLSVIINDKKQMDGVVSFINQFININEVYSLLASMAKNYVQHIGRSFMRVGAYFMNTFSIIFVIIIIVFYMLKDGHKFKEKLLVLIPEKYKKISDEIISDSDSILNHYVIGQAKVALCLSLMIFAGYKIIGLPNAILLSAITFILAFIPFVGFFISMIIPVVIAISMGTAMFLKLVALFIIVQTLKGRIVVPTIMAKTMKIHPLTDIFLVIGAIAVAGPYAAFAVVPIYAIVKNAVISIRKSGYF